MRTTYFRGPNYSALDADYIRAIAPSVFTHHGNDTVSDKYAVVRTDTIIDVLAKEGFHPVAAKQQGCHHPETAPFTRHLVIFRPQKFLNRAPDINEIIPEVLLRNSHDGRSAYQLCLGLFRQVCTNGMVVADSTLSKISVPHKGEGLMDRIIEGTYEIIANSDKAIDELMSWQGLKMRKADIETYAKNAFLLKHDVEDLDVYAWDTLYRIRRFEDQSNDLYHVFNRVQEGLMKGGIHGWKTMEGKKPRSVSTKSIRGIDANLKLNRELWELTQQTAITLN